MNQLIHMSCEVHEGFFEKHVVSLFVTVMVNRIISQNSTLR